jgi:clan AA aspartic protease (TIGR02281 family)
MNNNFRLSISVIVFLAALISEARADRVYLKNGRSMEGLVKQQDDTSVEFEVGIGFIKLRKTEIERIENSSPEEAAAIRRKWEEKKIKEQQEREVWAKQKKLEEERAPKEVTVNKESGHMIVKALLNKKINATLLVDTGASGVLLSKSMGDKLGIITDKTAKLDNPMVELTLADGRKAQAKYVVLQSVKVQDVEAYNVEGAVLLDDKAKIAYDGLLGMSFLNRFNFKFDNKQGKLILEKI